MNVLKKLDNFNKFIFVLHECTLFKNFEVLYKKIMAWKIDFKLMV